MPQEEDDEGEDGDGNEGEEEVIFVCQIVFALFLLSYSQD